MLVSFLVFLFALFLVFGAYLLASLVAAVYERLRWGASGDEMLDLGLFLSAIASIVAASPVHAELSTAGVRESSCGKSGRVGSLELEPDAWSGPIGSE